MMKKTLCILFLLFSFCQIHAQTDELEVDVEGSSIIDEYETMMPGDDEDFDTEESGSGEVSEELIPSIITEFEKEEPEVTETSTPHKKGDKTDTEVPEETPDNSRKDEKFPSDKEESEPDVNTELEENDGDVEVGETKSFLANSQFLAALIVGGCVGILFAVCVILLLAYRMRKKDEGSYALDDTKKTSSNAYQYTQGQEYYA